MFRLIKKLVIVTYNVGVYSINDFNLKKGTSMTQPIKTIDAQLGELDKENVFFCKRCITSNQRPRLSFDDEGVCSACRWTEEKENIDWDAREKELRALLDKHRSKDGSFDVIVPASGGKDSGFVAHQLKHEYGMTPLTVTWAPFEFTDIGFDNYNRMVHSGFDNLLFNPNGALHRKLARVAFDVKGDHWEPFTFGQKALAFQIATKFGIPLIFYGENGEVEYGGSMKNKDKAFESVEDWERLYFKGAGVRKLVEMGKEIGVIKDEDVRDGALSIYEAPPLEKIDALGAQMHWFSYYKKWIPQENFYYASEHMGFEPNPDGRSEGTYSKYASLDDKTDGFHWYLGFIKFGMGRATRDASMEIRAGHIDREEAVALANRYDGEFPKKWFPHFMEYLGIDEKHFWKICDGYRQDHIWDKRDGEWVLKHPIK